MLPTTRSTGLPSLHRGLSSADFLHPGAERKFCLRADVRAVSREQAEGMTEFDAVTVRGRRKTYGPLSSSTGWTSMSGVVRWPAWPTVLLVLALPDRRGRTS